MQIFFCPSPSHRGDGSRGGKVFTILTLFAHVAGRTVWLPSPKLPFWAFATAYPGPGRSKLDTVKGKNHPHNVDIAGKDGGRVQLHQDGQEGSVSRAICAHLACFSRVYSQESQPNNWNGCKVWSKSFVSPLLTTTQFQVSWFDITAVTTYLHTEPSPVFCGRKDLDCLACNPPCHAWARPNLFGQWTEALFTGAATPEPAPVGQLPRGI